MPPPVREQMREQMLSGFGGWTGMAITAVPTVVFVVANALSSLRAAVIAAIVSALVLAGYRLARRQSTQQALNGLVGVVVAALIAARTGQARGFFLLGIWTSFVYAGVFAASILLRRPLIGVIWEFLDPTPTGPADPPWYRRPHLARAYLLASLAATAVFAARAAVQLRLFAEDATGWLAVARIAMGYPLTIAALALAWWLVRRARRRISFEGSPAAS
ncbi:MAG: DUF3159 domain-containing protein [bacterium]